MTTITALPTPPSRSDPANFAVRGDAFMTALPTFATECNLVAGEVNTAKVAAELAETHAETAESNAAASALSAAASVTEAAAISGVSMWVSGATYAAGDCRWSPANFQTYRRKTGGAGTTDPSADATNWTLITTQHPAISVVAGTTQSAAVNTHYVLTNVAATTVTLPASPAEGDIIWVTVANALTTNVIARGGNEINGVAEDLTLDNAYATVQLRWVDSTRDWRIL